MMDLASPTSAFVRECCIRDLRAIVTRVDLYRAWKTWAEDNGHMSGAKSTFGRDLRAVVPESKAFRPRVGGVQVHCYRGIGLKSYGLNGVHPDSPDSEGEASQPESSESAESAFKAQQESTNGYRDPSGSFCPGCGTFFAVNSYHRADCLAVSDSRGGHR